MLLDLLGSVVLFFLLAFGLAWPLAARLALQPVEKILVATGLSLLGIFFLAWGIYIAGLTFRWLWLLPALALAGLAVARRSLIALAQDREARALGAGQLLVTLWCVGWLATVSSYSGGGWAGDWFEHWERTRFFFERWPFDSIFIKQYSLPARPPLANVLTGVFLHLTHFDFARYQLFSTLLASLVFLPAAVLARHWGGGRAVAILAVLLMVNPLFVQNATFAWTKLPAAFFALGGVWFFLRAHATCAPRSAGLLCATMLAAGLLAHYSVGPYAVVLVFLWLAFGWSRRGDRTWWRATALAAGAGALILTTWFGWSSATYGLRGTFLSNTSVTAEDVRQGSQIVKIGLNLFDTLVPHFLRSLDRSLIAQTSPWGWWRDCFFQCYQLNLPLAFGSVAWLALLREGWRAGREPTPERTRRFWIGGIAGVILLGVGTHGGRDHWGLAHICLQPLVLLGLAFLAARWKTLSQAWRLLLIAGATIDFMFGIALHFAVQNFALDRWLQPGASGLQVIASYNPLVANNAYTLATKHLDTFAETAAIPFSLALGALGLLFLLALAGARSGANGR